MDNLNPPRTRLVFVSGFLAAGKTTTIALLAQMLSARGRSAAVVTNDQAAGLVDTETIRVIGVPAVSCTESRPPFCSIRSSMYC